MTLKKLKYQNYLDSITNCPPSDYVEIDKVVYRWVKYDRKKDNFIPINIQNDPPPRILEKSDKNCQGYGLSLFDTEAHGIKHFKKVYLQRKPVEREKFRVKQDSIASVIIEKTDGLAGNLNKNNGHFTFHEYDDVDLEQKLDVINKVIDANGAFKDI